MKRITVIISIIIISLILSSCLSDKGKNTELEVQPEEFRYQDNLGNVLETSEGCYHMTHMGMDDSDLHIRFSEKGNHEFYTLCNKPECSHHDQNCNAFAGLSFGYYNDHIYYLYFENNGESMALGRMDMDGNNHKKITSLPNQKSADLGVTVVAGEGYFNNGYMILYLYRINQDPKSCGAIYKVELETGKIERLFEDEIKNDIYVDICSLYGDKIYFKEVTLTNESAKLYEGNMETGEIHMILEDFKVPSRAKRIGDILYYHKPKEGFFEYDLKAGEETLKLKTNFYYANIGHTKDMIVACATENPESGNNDFTTYVYDREYKLINQVKLDINTYGDIQQGFITSDAIYFVGELSGEIFYYIDRSKISKDKELELIRVKDPYSGR